MPALSLHDFHLARGATLTEINGEEAAASYSSIEDEYTALTQTAGVIDLSFRGRVCVLGADREKFLHGQVSNDILKLKVGQGCYAALVTAKGRMQSDLFVFKLRDELLLDFEPGFTRTILDRLQKYIIAEEVEALDVAPHYGMLSVQGPLSAELLQKSSLAEILPNEPLNWTSTMSQEGESYVANNARFGLPGFDLFVPHARMEATAQTLEEAAKSLRGSWVGFQACETVRIENGIPRFGIDMTETTIPQEAEIQERAVSYAKGCYIGQEVIARIRTYGQVAKALRIVGLPSGLSELPASGTKLFSAGKECGFITSSTHSPRDNQKRALAYIRKEVNALGTMLHLGDSTGSEVQIIGIPGKRAESDALPD
ncbi:MAG TPA: glycine cleavage T C-terminal barrel domain-containing protein [Verrucomicrobiae bacterium]|nr:glycine cleavage T C-terminal barrel domain-containing protein [Verrucomicrobiae bacterium]